MAGIKIGDKVTLINDGPEMTVLEIVGDRAICQWFDQQHCSHQAVYPIHVLAKADHDWPLFRAAVGS